MEMSARYDYICPADHAVSATEAAWLSVGVLYERIGVGCPYSLLCENKEKREVGQGLFLCAYEIGVLSVVQVR